MKNLVLILLILTLAGCATNYGAQQIDDFGRFTQLQVDQTTKEGTYELFGQPHDIKLLENGESVWIYYSVSMTMNGATFVPFIGLIAGGSNTQTRIANFYFSPDDLYQKVETLTNQQYVNQWIGIATVVAVNDEMDRVDEEMTKLGLPFDQALARQMRGTAELLGQ
jgi:hypothetical protein